MGAGPAGGAAGGAGGLVLTAWALRRAGLLDQRPGWRALFTLTTRFLPWR